MVANVFPRGARDPLPQRWMPEQPGECRCPVPDVSGDDRVAIYRRYVTLAKEHWGADAHGLERVTQFVRWHADFWYRYVRQRPDGSFPSLQGREQDLNARTPLELLLARPDGAAHDYLTECLVHEREIDPAAAPAPAESREPELADVEG